MSTWNYYWDPGGLPQNTFPVPANHDKPIFIQYPYATHFQQQVLQPQNPLQQQFYLQQEDPFKFQTNSGFHHQRQIQTQIPFFPHTATSPWPPQLENRFQTEDVPVPLIPRPQHDQIMIHSNYSNQHDDFQNKFELLIIENSDKSITYRKIEDDSIISQQNENLNNTQRHLIYNHDALQTELSNVKTNQRDIKSDFQIQSYLYEYSVHHLDNYFRREIFDIIKSVDLIDVKNLFAKSNYEYFSLSDIFSERRQPPTITEFKTPKKSAKRSTASLLSTTVVTTSNRFAPLSNSSPKPTRKNINKVNVFDPSIDIPDSIQESDILFENGQSQNLSNIIFREMGDPGKAQLPEEYRRKIESLTQSMNNYEEFRKTAEHFPGQIWEINKRLADNDARFHNLETSMNDNFSRLSGEISGISSLLQNMFHGQNPGPQQQTLSTSTQVRPAVK